MNLVPEQYQTEKDITVYGEWCGEGIQHGVGVSTLPKMFVIFDVKVGDSYLSVTDVMKFGRNMKEQRVLNIYNFETFLETVNRTTPLQNQARFVSLT